MTTAKKPKRCRLPRNPPAFYDSAPLFEAAFARFGITRHDMESRLHAKSSQWTIDDVRYLIDCFVELSESEK